MNADEWQPLVSLEARVLRFGKVIVVPATMPRLDVIRLHVVTPHTITLRSELQHIKGRTAEQLFDQNSHSFTLIQSLKNVSTKVSDTIAPYLSKKGSDSILTLTFDEFVLLRLSL